MAEVSQISTDDFEELYLKYLKDDDPRLDREDWFRLFQTFDQSVGSPMFGYKLTHAGRIVGMLGMIHSVREIDGQSIPFCNLHSWFVDEEHRGNSLALMRPILRMDDYVITDFSPTPAVVKISTRLGFRPFTIQQRMIPFSAKQSYPQDSNCQCSWNHESDSQSLNAAEQNIFTDHHDDKFYRLVIKTPNDRTLVILQKVTFHWRPYACVLYSSNPNLLVSTQGNWQDEIREKLRVKRIVGAEKYLKPELKGSFRVPFPNVQLYRSNKYEPAVVDTLYTEVSLLGLTTLPGIKSIVRESVRRLNPLSWLRRKR